jgi:ComF family protein
MGSVREYITDFSRSVRNVVFPPLCLLCEDTLEEEGLVCPGCLGRLEKLTEPLCERCGATRTGHDVCICDALPPELARLRSAVSYEGVAKDIVHFYKFSGYWSLASVLGDTMCDPARALVAREERTVVMGAPLHRARFRERGYDQAGLLARHLSSRLGLPLAEGVVRRGRNTRPQAELSLEERKVNLRGAFSVKDTSKIAGRTVLLVDDVFTTGVTMAECARALTSAGARRVLGLTFARRMKSGTA